MKGKPKKILFITNYPSPYRIDFFNELGKHPMINLSVVFLEKASEQTHRNSQWFHDDYSSFKPIFLNKKKLLIKNQYVFLDIKDEIKKDYDEIIFGGYSYPTMLYAMQLLINASKPYSIEIDGAFISNDSFIKKQIKKHFISNASRWYSSGTFSDQYLIHYGASKDKIVHYPFTSLFQREVDVDLSEEQFIERKRQLNEQLKLNGEMVVLSIGQFIYRKGIDILLDAATRLPREFHFYIIGDNPSEEYLTIVKTKNLDNVHFLGFIEKASLIDYYRASDIFVLPTREDIWGLVINEALANGVPTVTTDRCIAGLELIDQGINGYIVSAGNAEELADAIWKISHKDIFEMRRRALQKSKAYTIENMAKKHVDIILGELDD